MDEQARQLAGLLEDVMYNLGTYNMSSNCCENISHGEFRALRAMSRLNRCTMQDIAKSIAVTKSGATRIVSRLEEKKLVSRMNDPSDGRICCVQLSKAGNSLISRLTEEPAKRMAGILSAMTPEMRQILLIGLRTLVETAFKQNENAAEKQKPAKVNRKRLTRK